MSDMLCFSRFIDYFIYMFFFYSKSSFLWFVEGSASFSRFLGLSWQEGELRLAASFSVYSCFLSLTVKTLLLRFMTMPGGSIAFLS
jgi:hypothetical protein